MGGADVASERQRISDRERYEVDMNVEPMAFNGGRPSATSRKDETRFLIIPIGVAE